jgi:hypothetical protein
MTGGAFSLTSIHPSTSFEVTTGEPVIGGLRGPTAHHFFCPSCMSWLFTRPEGYDHIVNVRSTLFDQPRGEPPFIETYTSEKLPWAETGATHSFETFPSPEAFPELLAEFAARADQGRQG